MSTFDNEKYKALINNCGLTFKRVLKKDLSKNKLKHIEYAIALITAYNEFASYAFNFFGVLTPRSQTDVKNDWSIRVKLNQSFSKILHKFEVPKELNPQQSGSNLQSANPETTSIAEAITETENDIAIGDLFTMANQMTNLEFLNLASKYINKNYAGDPLALNSFINSLELLNDFATDALQPTLFRFVKSKLDGKALEAIQGNPDINSVQKIIDSLKAQIRPVNSKVVAGRMLALKPDKTKLTEFSEQAESLAEALQRSLIIEGIPQAKAREMTIEKTVELCRTAAKSDLVKSVLAASHFDSPKEVIAKYLVENATETTEKQILSYQKYSNKNSHNRGNNRYNNNNRGNRSCGNNNRNNYRGRRGNRYNGRGNNRNSYNNGYRGNGQNNNDNRNYRNVRYMGNGEAPQIQLGDAQNNPRDGNQNKFSALISIIPNLFE